MDERYNYQRVSARIGQYLSMRPRRQQCSIHLTPLRFLRPRFMRAMAPQCLIQVNMREGSGGQVLCQQPVRDHQTIEKPPKGSILDQQRLRNMIAAAEEQLRPQEQASESLQVVTDNKDKYSSSLARATSQIQNMTNTSVFLAKTIQVWKMTMEKCSKEEEKFTRPVNQSV